MGRLETFRALRNNRNFRLYWAGALASNAGTFMQTLAQGWLVYQLTASSFMLGLVTFSTSVPMLIFGLYGGVLADRIERRRLMLYTQVVLMALAFLLAGLTLAGVVTITEIIALAFLNGTVMALVVPVRQSLVNDLVPRADLQNAIAINSLQVQSSRILGPAIAGLLLALVGPGWCFFINGLSFLAVIWSLLVVRVPPLPPQPRASALRSVYESLLYVRNQPTLLALLLLAAIPNLFGTPYQYMLPAFAAAVLHVGGAELGLLQSAAGVGALACALTLASLPPGGRSGALLLGATIGLGCGLVAFGLSRSFPLSMALLVGVGVANMAYTTLNQTFLQHNVADHMRGRVLALMALVTFGLQPFGAMQMGTLATLFGNQPGMVFAGLVCIIAAVVVLLRWPALRALR